MSVVIGNDFVLPWDVISRLWCLHSFKGDDHDLTCVLRIHGSNCCDSGNNASIFGGNDAYGSLSLDTLRDMGSKSSR